MHRQTISAAVSCRTRRFRLVKNCSFHTATHGKSLYCCSVVRLISRWSNDDVFPCRFVAREGEFGAIAISESYAASDNILSSIWSLASLNSEDKVSDMISMVKSTVVKDARSLSALSSIHSSEDLEKAVSRNGTALATMELRSLQWLEENGKLFVHCCLAAFLV